GSRIGKEESTLRQHIGFSNRHVPHHRAAWRCVANPAESHADHGARGEPLAVQCLTRLDELRGLRKEWDDLVRETESASIFQTWEWVTTWYEHLGSNRDILLLTVRDGQGRLVGLAPFSLSRRRGGRVLHLLGFKNTLTEYFDATLHPDSADSAAE